MAQKLNQELQNHHSPEPQSLDRAKEFIIFPRNTYYAFHPYSEPKDFAPTRSILVKDGTVHRNVAERGSFASNVKSTKGKKKKDSLLSPSLTESRSPSIITQCWWWFHVVFFFLHKQCHLPLLLRMLLGDSEKNKKVVFWDPSWWFKTARCQIRSF